MSTVLQPSSKLEYDRAYRREWTAGKQDVGAIPAVADPIRRRDCLADFSLYCKTYHAEEFSKQWAPYQKRLAERIQSAVEEGGWRAEGVPRGGGKTTFFRAGIEWSALRGSKLYPILIGANDSLARKLLRGIKTQLFTNELLLSDFPHALYPIWKLGNEARRASGQKWNGKPTFIEWATDRVVLPWIDHEDSLSNCVLLEAHGITAALRGMQYTRPDGRTVRPDIGLVDDPQTRESAKSPAQTMARLETLTGDIAYLAGPGEKMPVFAGVTVIYEGDLSDQILDRDKHPEWHGERTKMVEAFPTNMELWDKYADILRASLREDGGAEPANEFLKANWEAMHAGAKVSWEERKRDDELSALQHAMNLKIRDEAAFYAECQNEPIQQQDDLELLPADKIAAKISGYARGVVPSECSTITAFTDVQGEHLFWMVCAWTPDFTGYVIDYGAWPEQGRNYFTRRDVRQKLSLKYPGDESGMTFAALNDLAEHIAGRAYKTHDGRVMKLARWCIDGNWRARTKAVESFARQSEFASIITITQGRGVKASERPFSEAQRSIKWRTGPAWFWQDGPGPARWVTFDANLWKKRVHEGLLLARESRGSIQLFKAAPHVHQMLADHLRADRKSVV